MYLSNLFIENMWSIEKLQILEKDLFLENWNPKPVILLWKNWSWKTTLISSITDSLLELANHAFKDVLPSDWLWHSYYKISWWINTTLRKEYGFSFIQYKNDKKHYQYIDKNWNLSFEDCEKKTNNLVSIHDKRDNEKNYKSSTDTKNDMQFADDLKNNSYCVFPDDRFEFPHWLNRETDKKITNFNLPNLFNWELGKNILIKSSLDTIKPRILDLFLDSRTWLKKAKDWKSYITTQSSQIVEYLQQWVDNINHLLSSILWKNIVIDSNFRWQWNSRIRIIDKKTNQDVIPSLDNLSAWESILLWMFGTIIKYSDLADINKSVKLEDIEWIVVIDEVDLHLHIRLQKEVLPKLIKLFPKVQFIISTHSPFFLYGMNEEFWDNVLMLNMPSGLQVTNVDDFDEFNQAYYVFDKLTQDYKRKYQDLENDIKNKEKHFIMCEWKTDHIHIKKSIEKLWINDLKNIEFLEIPEDWWWDDNLYDFLEKISIVPHKNKIIGIFDRDNKTYVDKKIKDWKEFWNNVYWFCIPCPKWREKYNKISIEFYYDDKDLKHKYNWECLYFDNEVLYDPKKKQWVLIKNPKDIEDKQIFDKDIWNTKWICSKWRFAELVATNKNFTKDFNFENFRLIIDKIKEILGKDD